MGLRDPFSSASHLLFAVWAIYAFLVLIRLSPHRWQASSIIYGISMIMMFVASGVFHGVPFTRLDNPDEFRMFQKLDHSTIFILIAGTNTPVMATILQGAMRRWCLRGMWTLAILGVASLWLFPKPPHEVMVILCMGMGWLGMLPARQYYRALGWRAMNWVLLGSILYSIGAACEIAEWPFICNYPLRIGFHEIFHVFSGIAGVVFFMFIARYVIPYRPIPQPANLM